MEIEHHGVKFFQLIGYLMTDGYVGLLVDRLNYDVYHREIDYELLYLVPCHDQIVCLSVVHVFSISLVFGVVLDQLLSVICSSSPSAFAQEILSLSIPMRCLLLPFQNPID